jgi:hypothetical protein
MSPSQPNNTDPQGNPWSQTDDLRAIDLGVEGVWDSTVRPVRPQILRHLPLEILQQLPPAVLQRLPAEILRQLPRPPAPPPENI